MKPKSFKSTERRKYDLAYGVSLKQRYFQQLTPKHFRFGVDQLSIDSNEQILIKWSLLLDAKDPDYYFDVFALDDNVAITIDTNSQVLLAIVTDVVQVDNQLQVTLTEHRRELQALGQAPSLQWISFLKELKKCGSGHHNKKQKTLLHLIKIAQAQEDKPERILLTVRPMRPIIDTDVVEPMQEAIIEAATEGSYLSLDEIEQFFPEEPKVIDANYFPRRVEVEATTFVRNGGRVEISTTLDIEGVLTDSITISKLDLTRDLIYNTKTPLLDEDPYHPAPEPMLADWEADSSNTERILSIYSHEDGLAVYHNITVKNISVLPNGDVVVALEHNLEARRLRSVDMANIDNALVTIIGYHTRPEEPAVPPGWSPYPDDLIRNPLLAIAPGMYKFLKPQPESNDRERLRITEPLAQETGAANLDLSRFVEGEPYLVSVGNTHSAAVRVDSVTFDAVEKKATVDFAYEGGRRVWGLEQVPYAQQREKLSMKRLFEASPQQHAAITLTLERAAELDEPAAALPDGDSDGDDLKAIADGIRGLLQDDPDGEVSLLELNAWLEQNQRDPDLKVIGVEHVAQQQPTETSSSVTGGMDIEAWEPENGKYMYLDLDPVDAQLTNVKSLFYKSRLVEDAPEPVSEVEEKLLVTHLDEMRAIDLDVVPGGEYGVNAFLSIYSAGEGGYAVCNNERIYRILRKKKDGKCIYRIVMKKGVRANRIAHGKHQTCVMYIDQQTDPVS